MTSACDVLVIGLGPAGAAAATAAAQAGARVVAIERRPSHAGPVHGPEFLPLPLGRFAGADSVVIQNIGSTRRHFPDGREADVGLPGCVVDRDVFDRVLIDFARAAGAEVRHGTLLSDLDMDLCVATLAAAGGTSKLRFRALVAADGHASMVARLLGMAPLKTMYQQRYRVPLQVPQDTIDAWLSPQFPGGYGWLIPAGREAIIGTGMAPGTAPAALDALHRQLQAGGLVGEEVRARAAGPVAVGGLRSSLVWGNVLFAGDAAGLAHPLTGAGVCPAVVSGEAAGRAAARWSAGHLGAIPDYDARMRGEFGETMTRALLRRELFESPWHDSPDSRGLEASGWSVVRGAFET